MFSTVVRHPMSLMPTAPVVFLQYLAALAIVEGIKTYAKGFQRMPVKLKWPNDICTLVVIFKFSLSTISLTMCRSTRRFRSF